MRERASAAVVVYGMGMPQAYVLGKGVLLLCDHHCWLGNLCIRARILSHDLS